jgi:hypothetical protein
MNLTFKVFAASKLLRVEVTGDFSRAEALETIDPTLEVLIQHSLRKVLVDIRQVKGNPSTMDRYAFSVALAEKFNKACTSGADASTRFGFVGKEPMVEKDRFGETVAVNRGLNLKVMEDMDEALQWLGIDPGYDIGESE